LCTSGSGSQVVCSDEGRIIRPGGGNDAGVCLLTLLRSFCFCHFLFLLRCCVVCAIRFALLFRLIRIPRQAFVWPRATSRLRSACSCWIMFRFSISSRLSLCRSASRAALIFFCSRSFRVCSQASSSLSCSTLLLNFCSRLAAAAAARASSLHRLNYFMP
jgi:hypothetical protein